MLSIPCCVLASRHVPRVSRSQGFTLIELMMVVVIVAILLAVALPSYQGSLQKGRRSDAMSTLLDVANRQQQFMLDRSTYTTVLTDLGFNASPLVSEEGYYSISVSVPNAAGEACEGATIATCFVVTATPVASSPQSSDSRCASFSLDSYGRRSATGSAASECW